MSAAFRSRWVLPLVTLLATASAVHAWTWTLPRAAEDCAAFVGVPVPGPDDVLIPLGVARDCFGERQDASVQALNAGDGTTRWHWTFEGGRGLSGVQTISRTADGDALVHLTTRFADTDDSTIAVLVMLDGATGTERWRREVTGRGAILAAGDVLAVTDDTVERLDGATGVSRWSRVHGLWRGFVVGVRPDGAIVIAGGDPITEAPQTLIVVAPDDGAELRRVTLEDRDGMGRIGAVALDAAGNVVAGATIPGTFAPVMLSLDAVSFAQRWRVTPPDWARGGFGSTVVAGGAWVHAGYLAEPDPFALSDSLLVLDAASGAERWRWGAATRVSDPVSIDTAAMAADGDVVLAGRLQRATGTSMLLVRLSGVDGTVRWLRDGDDLGLDATGIGSWAHVAVDAAGDLVVAWTRGWPDEQVTVVRTLSGATGLPPACGDGHVDAGESCDDGNAVDGDGCDVSCRPEPCTDATMPGCAPPAPPEPCADPTAPACAPPPAPDACAGRRRHERAACVLAAGLPAACAADRLPRALTRALRRSGVALRHAVETPGRSSWFGRRALRRLGRVDARSARAVDDGRISPACGAALASTVASAMAAAHEAP